MKWVQFLLLILLIVTALTASAQRRPQAGKMQELRLRLNDLQLTAEQKSRIADLIRRERLQSYRNQQELNDILTDKQKALLIDWQKKRQGNKCDSTVINK
jgi:hypothetical protein